MDSKEKPLDGIGQSVRMGPDDLMMGVMASKANMYNSDNEDDDCDDEDQDVMYYDEEEDEDENDSIELVNGKRPSNQDERQSNQPSEDLANFDDEEHQGASLDPTF